MRPLILAGLLACGGTPTQSPNIPAAECVSHRTAKELECVDLNPDRASIDACRTKVKAAIDCTKDGGSHD